MKNSGEVILSDIDLILDQLIRNADAMNQIKDRSHFMNEVRAMHKTQENLITRLLHMHDLYESETPSPIQETRLMHIDNKLSQFGRLNARMIAHLENGLKRKKATVRTRRKRIKN